MTLRQASQQTGKAYSTLHGHIKQGLLKADYYYKGNTRFIDITEHSLKMYLEKEAFRDLLTREIMSEIMLYIDNKVGQNIINTMSDEVNDNFQIMIEKAIEYLFKELKC